MKITSVRVRTMVWVMVPQTAGSVMLSKDAKRGPSIGPHGHSLVFSLDFSSETLLGVES